MSPWTPSLSVSTPASIASESQAKPRSSTTKKTASTSSQQMDFSNHPGMRILTKDGRDITNSAARGCKSKEQRDHAHLMRIIKACDACRRKKIRCDPSHKKRTASQTQNPQSRSKHAKQAKAVVHESQNHGFTLTTPNLPVTGPSFEEESNPAVSFETFNENPDNFWEQFVRFDEQTISVPDDYGFFLDPAGYLTSSNGSSYASPSQNLESATPAAPGDYNSFSDLVVQQPALPYLNPDDSYGTNYQDFNLYSPGSDFLDEEPQLAKKSRLRTASEQQGGQQGSLYQQTSPEHSSSGGNDSQMYSGIDHQHFPRLDTSLYDWALVDIDRSRSQFAAQTLHGPQAHLPSAIDAVDESTLNHTGRSRHGSSVSIDPDPTPSINYASFRPDHPATPLPSSDGTLCLSHPKGFASRIPLRATTPGRQPTVVPLPEGYSWASTSAQGLSTSSSVNMRLYTSRSSTGVVDPSGILPTAIKSQLAVPHSRPRSEDLASAPSVPYSVPIAEDLSDIGHTGFGRTGSAPPPQRPLHASSYSQRPVGNASGLTSSSHFGGLTDNAALSSPTSCSPLSVSVVPEGSGGAGLGYLSQGTFTDVHSSPMPVPKLVLRLVPNASTSGGLASLLQLSPPKARLQSGLPEGLGQPSWLGASLRLCQQVAFGLVSCLLVSCMRSQTLHHGLGVLFVLSLYALCTRWSSSERQRVWRPTLSSVVDEVKQSVPSHLELADGIPCAITRLVKGPLRSLRGTMLGPLAMR
jgi:hypothetical protein